jgi:hypothetical protein
MADSHPFVEEGDTMRAEVSLADMRSMEVSVYLCVLVGVYEFLRNFPARLAHKQHDRDCQNPG